MNREEIMPEVDSVYYWKVYIHYSGLNALYVARKSTTIMTVMMVIMNITSDRAIHSVFGSLEITVRLKLFQEVLICIIIFYIIDYVKFNLCLDTSTKNWF